MKINWAGPSKRVKKNDFHSTKDTTWNLWEALHHTTKTKARSWLRPKLNRISSIWLALFWETFSPLKTAVVNRHFSNQIWSANRCCQYQTWTTTNQVGDEVDSSKDPLFANTRPQLVSTLSVLLKASQPRLLFSVCPQHVTQCFYPGTNFIDSSSEIYCPQSLFLVKSIGLQSLCFLVM